MARGSYSCEILVASAESMMLTRPPIVFSVCDKFQNRRITDNLGCNTNSSQSNERLIFQQN